MCEAIGLALIVGFSAVAMAIIYKATLRYAEFRETINFYVDARRSDDEEITGEVVTFPDPGGRPAA